MFYVVSQLVILALGCDTLFLSVWCQIVVVVDGKEVFEFKVALPSVRASHMEMRCYMAGGSVSSHTLERHIKLMGADKSKLTWMLGSLNIFQGESSLSLSHTHTHTSILYLHGTGKEFLRVLTCEIRNCP